MLVRVALLLARIVPGLWHLVLSHFQLFTQISNIVYRSKANSIHSISCPQLQMLKIRGTILHKTFTPPKNPDR
jgi:hypothetical protein